MFDLGGVLVELDDAWPAHAGLDPEAVRAWLHTAEPFHAMERGELSETRFLHALADRFRPPPAFGPHDRAIEPLREALARWVKGAYPGATALLDQLAVPAAALSNTNRVHWSVFDPDRALRSRLVPALASHHLGARKPDPTAFARAQAILGPMQVLFLDDSPANVDAARRFGWEAERVHGLDAVRDLLDARGLLGTRRADGA